MTQTTPTPGQPLSEADVLPCTDCDGTGITTQSERPCSCSAGDAYRPHAPVSRPAGEGETTQHTPRCWGRTSYSDEMAHCYCKPAGEGEREAVARLIWERFAPSSDMDEANAMRGEYVIAADAILAILRPAAPDAGGGEDKRDAERFRALMRCGRIKMQGSSGVDPHTLGRNGNNVHFGAEFWPEPYDPEKWEATYGQSTRWGRACLMHLADAILEQEAALQPGGER